MDCTRNPRNQKWITKIEQPREFSTSHLKLHVPYLEGTYRKNTDQNMIQYLERTLQITEQEEFMTEKRVLV